MTTKELVISPAFRAAVAESVQEILNDPDFGMELTAQAKKRLRASMRGRKPGKSLSEIRAKYC